MGKAISSRMFSLSEKLGVTIDIKPATSAENSSFKTFKTIDPDNGTYLKKINSKISKIYFTRSDVFGKPAVLLEVKLPRRYYQLGLKTVRLFLILILIFIGLILFFAVFTVHKFALPRFHSITLNLQKIRESGNLSIRIPYLKYDILFKDEITIIKNWINEMLLKLQSSQEEISNKNKELEAKVLERTAELQNEIKHRIMIENQLRESETRFRLMAENLMDGILIIENNKVIFANKRAEEITGIPRNNLSIDSIATLILPEYRNKFLSIVNVQKRNKSYKYPSKLETFWINSKNNTKRFIIATHTSLSTNGKSIQYITLTDLTEEKNTEEKYQTVVENAHEGIIVVQDLSIKFFNRIVQEGTGYTPEELYSKKLFDFVYPDDYPLAIQCYNFYMKTGTLPKISLRILRKDSTVIWVEIDVKKINWEGAPAYIIFFKDITEQKKVENEKNALQQQLIQFQKLQSIQNLAGGIAHDLNNMLTPVLGYSQLGIEASDPQQVKHFLQEIQNAAGRASRLVQKLLAFSRKQMLNLKRVSINDIIINFRGFLRSLLEENIELTYILQENVYPILADPHQIEQVIMNIVTNSRDAMPDGGKLVIKTENAYIDDEYCKRNIKAQPGKYIRLRISDTGKGIPEDKAETIFEPFFTTKEIGKGSGLGLAVVLGIVEQHKGWIEVKSKPEHGTEFSIYFPAISEEIKQDVDSLQDIHKIPTRYINPEKDHKKNISSKISNIYLEGKGKKILLIEDDELVRNFTRNILSRKGFEVLTAVTTEGARRILDSEKDNIDLIITDLILPRESGLQFIESIHNRYRTTKYLLISGYSDDKLEREKLSKLGCRFLKKPFHPEELYEHIKKLFLRDTMEPSNKYKTK